MRSEVELKVPLYNLHILPTTVYVLFHRKAYGIINLRVGKSNINRFI